MPRSEIRVLNVMRSHGDKKPILVTLECYPFIVSFHEKNGRVRLFSKFNVEDRGGKVEISAQIFKEFCRKAAAIFFKRRP